MFRKKPSAFQKYQVHANKQANQVLATGTLYLGSLSVIGGTFALVWQLSGLAHDLWIPIWWAYSGAIVATFGYILAKREAVKGPLMFVFFSLLVSWPSMLYLIAHFSLPSGAVSFINGPTFLIYSFLIILSGFMFDRRLSAFVGVVAGVEHFALFFIDRRHLLSIQTLDPVLKQDLSDPAIYFLKSLVLFFSGLAVGVIAKTAYALVSKIMAEEEEKQNLQGIVNEEIKKNLEREISHSEALLDSQKEVILRMGAIAETRSKETGQHVQRVAAYSHLLGQLSGLDKSEVQLIKLASPMHDIGKVAIPDSILKKPGKLTNEEFGTMKDHAQVGYDMLASSKYKILQISAQISLTHHEKWDGSGYPNGLSGEDIPLVGRITAIADVFDALGSDRCYKEAWGLDKILDLFKEQRGKQFDPTLIDVFFANLDQIIEIRDRLKG